MSTEAEVQEHRNLPQDVPPAETLTPGLAQSEDEDLSTPAVEFRTVYFSFDDEKVLDGTDARVAIRYVRKVEESKRAAVDAMQLNSRKNVHLLAT